MTISEYLDRAQDLLRRAERLKQKYEEKRTAAMSAGSGLMVGGSGRGRSHNARDKMLAAMVDAEQQYKEALLDYVSTRHDTFIEIMRLQDPDEAGALIARYLDRIPINEIGKAKFYFVGNKEKSRSQVFRLLRSGKEKLREQLKRFGEDIE